MASAYSFLESRNEIPQIKELRPDGEWHLPPGSNPRVIRAIHVSEEDDHVFLVDCYNNNSIIEFNKRGEFLTEFCFDDQNNENFFCFKPYDVCSISPDSLVVCGGKPSEFDGIIIFLERTECPPFLKLNKIITPDEIFLYSLYLKNESIFCLDFDCKIHSFSKDGEKLKTIEIDGLTGLVGFISRIRADPSSGQFWGSTLESSEIVSFNSEGETFDSVEKGGKEFFDFSFDKFGQLCFPTKKGIFSCFPEIKLLFEFPETSEDYPPMSVSENKMFVCIQNEGKNVIKVFKIIY